MTPLERLKLLTRPMNQVELEAFLLEHYGALSRENVSSDETAADFSASDEISVNLAEVDRQQTKKPEGEA